MNISILPKNKTIRRELTSMVVISASVVALILIVCLAVYELVNVLREGRAQVSVLADVTAENIAPALVFKDPKSISQTLESFSAEPSILWIIVQDDEAKIISYYNRNNNKVDIGEINIKMSKIRSEASSLTWNIFDVTADIYRPVIHNGANVGTIYVELDSSVVQKRISEFFWITLVVLVCSTIFTIVFAKRLGRLVSTPIEQMAALMHLVSTTKDYNLRSVVKTENEIGLLSDGLNEMLHEVQVRDAQQLERQQHLDRLANYDGLTGLANRILFDDRLKQALEHAKRRQEAFALFFIDLDDFKQVNDNYGHKAGDLLLCEAARRLESSVRVEDTAARMGGDEFTAVLLNIQSVENALLVARKLLRNLVATYSIDGTDMFVGASIGVSVYPSHGLTTQELMRRADIAMYHAKDLGKNNVVVFNSSLLDRSSEHDQLRNDLQHALEMDQFELYYQPRIDLEDGHFVGAEALLRWNHPERGLIAPESIIALAEETGLIVAIGKRVIEMCCDELKVLHGCGLFLPGVSINLSPIQLMQADLVDQFRENIVRTGICCNILEIEFPESVLSDDNTQIAKNLSGLAALGIKVCVDNFGAGAISLNRLMELNIHALSLSPSLLFKSDDGKAIKAIQAFAVSAELELLYKGIETYEQEMFVRSLGGRLAQGFHYSRPLQLLSLTTFLQTLGHFTAKYSNCPNFPDSTVCCKVAMREQPLHADSGVIV